MKLTINSIRDFYGLGENLLKGFLLAKGKRGYLRQLVDGRNYLLNPPINIPANGLKIDSLGDKNKDKIICIIRFPLGWIPTAGFFALFHRTLGGLYFADKFNFVPVIDNWTGCPYEESEPVNGTTSVWEYFFEPVSKVTMQEALYSNKVFCISNPNMDLCMLDHHTEWFAPSKEYLQDLAKVYTKFVRFNKFTKRKLESDLSTLDLNFNETLGIHYRGTDYNLNVNGHPVSVEIEDYFEDIDRLFTYEKIKKVFIATDDKTALSKIKERYADKIMCYEDAIRSDGVTGIHFQKDNKEKMHKYQIGYEVLRDAYTLSKCNSIISSASMVPVNAKIMRYSTGKDFVFERTISHGINHNNKDWVKMVKKGEMK